MGGIAMVTIRFAPEPSAALLLSAGVAFCVLLAKRRGRR